MLLAQGAAEERARIDEKVLLLWDWFRDEGASADRSYNAVFKAVCGRRRTTLPDLLPPAAARAALAEAERKIGVMRAALWNITQALSLGSSTRTARKILEDTR